MLKCDSESHHKSHQNPSTCRECLPYRHFVRQRGYPVTISVHYSAENQEEAGQDTGGNQQQPPEVFWWLHGICLDSFKCDYDSRNPPDGACNKIQVFPLHRLSVLGEVIFLSDFLSLSIRKAAEICLPARTEIYMPSP